MSQCGLEATSSPPAARLLWSCKSFQGSSKAAVHQYLVNGTVGKLAPRCPDFAHEMPDSTTSATGSAQPEMHLQSFAGECAAGGNLPPPLRLLCQVQGGCNVTDMQRVRQVHLVGEDEQGSVLQGRWRKASRPLRAPEVLLKAHMFSSPAV